MDSDDKRLKFGEWSFMQGGPKDAQRLLDNYLATGEYPESFELYLSDYADFEKSGYWPERDF